MSCAHWTNRNFDKVVSLLADTNILSGLVRQAQGTLANRMVQAGEQTRCTSIIVVAERRFGVAKADFPVRFQGLGRPYGDPLPYPGVLQCPVIGRVRTFPSTGY